MLTSYKIVLVRIPFIDDLSQSKLRPLLVLTKARTRYNLVIVAFITSRTFHRIDTDLELNLSISKLQHSGLKKNSVIRFHKLATIAMMDMKAEVGVVPPVLHSQIKARLKKIFEV